MILLAIINFTFLFGLSNCQYDYDSFESVEVAVPDYIADTIEQSIADTEDYLYDSAPEVDSGSTLQAARRIYFRPKGITLLRNIHNYLPKQIFKSLKIHIILFSFIKGSVVPKTIISFDHFLAFQDTFNFWHSL